MQFNFDVGSAPKSERNFDPLPAGWYPAQVIESSVEPLKSGNGTGLKLTLEVLAEGFRGRRVWASLNVRHNNPEAEKIGQSTLRELCEALGIGRLNDTTQLHNKPVSMKLKIRDDKTGQYGPSNDVQGFKAIDAAPTPASAQRGFPSAPPRSMPPAAGAPATTSAPAAPASRPITQEVPSTPTTTSPSEAPAQASLPVDQPAPAQAPARAAAPAGAPPWARRAA